MTGLRGVQMIEKGNRCFCGRTLHTDISGYKVSLEALGAIMRQMMATTESTDTLVTTVRCPPCRTPDVSAHPLPLNGPRCLSYQCDASHNSPHALAKGSAGVRVASTASKP